MAGNPLVSVVLPVLNAERYVKGAVASLLGQTFDDFEFLIVDGGSSDNTLAVVARCAATDERIRLHRQDNFGLADSLNLGCKLAQGQYIARMDADDVSLPNRLESQVRFLERNTEVALVGGAIQVVDAVGIPLFEIKFPTESSEIAAALLSYNCIAHPTVLMRRDAFLATGGYRKVFRGAEDYALWLRLSEQFELRNLEETLLYYRVDPEKMTVSRLETQVMSSCAAQAAARCRRKLGRDPIRDTDQITPELLDKLGVSEGSLTTPLLEACRWAADVVIRTGRDDIALQILDEAIARSRGGGVPKELVAGLHWTCFGIHRRRNDVLGGLPAAARGFSSHPIAVMKMAAASFLRRTESSARSG